MAFATESGRLAQVAAETDDDAFARPTRCIPWTAGELLYHAQLGMARLERMLAEPEPAPEARAALVTAPDYFRPGPRFSPAVDDDRVQSARDGAAALGGAAARARDFTRARKQALGLLRAASPARVVVTRHGDQMLLTEFTRTRVLELAVHGLDLADALNRQPWMTSSAAKVTEELLLPAEGAAARLRAAAGWDQVTLIAMLSGRAQPTRAEGRLIQSLGVRRLALG